MEKIASMEGLTIFERRQNILRLLAEQPGLRVGDMADMFQVSEGTIRNDLNALESEGQLRRVRGGAVLSRAADVDAQCGPQRKRKRAPGQSCGNQAADRTLGGRND
jgi:DeoR/GlpR family transcriptional regulator of sugar metabolism